MKKKELFKKISFAMAVIASTGMLCACGSNGASMSMDRKSADSEPAAYYTDDVMYAGAGDYYDEVENYDGDFGTTADTAPINENQANASVAKNRKLIRTVDMDIETTGFDDTIRSINIISRTQPVYASIKVTGKNRNYTENEDKSRAGA